MKELGILKYGFQRTGRHMSPLKAFVKGWTNLQSDWTNPFVDHIQADQSDLVPLVQLGCLSSMLLIGVRGNHECYLTFAQTSWQ